MRKFYGFLSLILFFLLCISIAYNFYLQYKNFILYINQPLSDKDEVVNIYIPPASTAKKVLQILKENEFDINKYYFLYWIKKNKLGNKLKAGEYAIRRNYSINQILSIIITGKSEIHKFTIKEGQTINEIIEELSKRKIINKDIFFNYLNNSTFIKQITNLEVNSLEGFFFPDSYDIPKYLKEEQIIRKFVDRFNQVTKQLFEENQTKLSKYDIIKLASIIEKEAAVDTERAIISGVYHNRIKKGMKLEADPTILYTMNGYKNKLTYKDLEIQSDYNTYLYSGFPPTPICNPGIKSIEAALKPAKHNYLFFVSKGNGTHYFSKTIQEHKRAIKLIKELSISQ
ncbi:MAG TPA: endolytic transglycosylase MltG [bacterium]|mgnify:CR=1 FL=1|nr:endolytic transglycosylase MltG [bacterium]HOL48377.1 endolytic transglycosylase MltG [bacterium]HPQ19657.1 endolytic transglycosylase MltG [bacterium]